MLLQCCSLMSHWTNMKLVTLLYAKSLKNLLRGTNHKNNSLISGKAFQVDSWTIVINGHFSKAMERFSRFLIFYFARCTYLVKNKYHTPAMRWPHCWSKGLLLQCSHTCMYRNTQVYRDFSVIIWILSVKNKNKLWVYSKKFMAIYK